MTEPNSVTTERTQLSVRAGSSRKLLARKALEKVSPSAMDEEALEASFPETNALSNDDTTTSISDVPATAVVAPRPLVTPGATPATASAQAWSPHDESALQALLARRKAAGYQRRGRDVGSQVITTGTIKPNAGTVVAVIVSIVAERGGSVGRAELVGAMAYADFPHAKAQPSDKAWCQGYVAGAIRNGFLTVAEHAPVTAQVA